ncbi:MAG: hypothetical protein MZU95_09980 [Desulfomicrobium escambiense]|nr:hypothetical protein [Desulfomicrobium escambiense]
MTHIGKYAVLSFRRHRDDELRQGMEVSQGGRFIGGIRQVPRRDSVTGSSSGSAQR